MSELKVPVVRIQTVEKHPKADRLDLVTIEGWQCVAGRDQFKPGDVAVYVPIDSVLPQWLEDQIFAGSKMKRDGHRRIKTVKIRDVVSQGLLLKPEELPGMSYVTRDDASVGEDVGEALGITKYEPPEPGFSFQPGQGRAKQPRRDNPAFPRFTDLQNIKWYPSLFKEGEHVVMTEKIHGTNFRAGYVAYNADKWWRKALSFIGLLPKQEFVWGSRTVQLQGKGSGGWFAKSTGTCVYREACDKYDLEAKLKPNEVVFGEVYGSKIQKGYTYGCEPGERRLVIFDVMKDGKWLSPLEVQDFCMERGLPAVPVLWVGPFNKAVLKLATEGASVLDSSQKVREGAVVRSLAEERVENFGRKMLKSVSPEYLLGDPSEFH